MCKPKRHIIYAMLCMMLFTFVLHLGSAKPDFEHQNFAKSKIVAHKLFHAENNQKKSVQVFDAKNKTKKKSTSTDHPLCTEHGHMECCSVPVNTNKDYCLTGSFVHKKFVYDHKSNLLKTFIFELLKPPIV